MIKRLEIKNFQSHKDTFLEFHEGVNVIIGSSDSGKTAIKRSMDWVINNKPSGDSFRSNWGGDTIVTLNSSTSIIERGKTKKENYYKINEKDSFYSFKTDVPEEVKKLLNFNSVNIQNQMDAPFLLASSAGEIARYFNSVLKLDKIDSTLAIIERRKREEERNLNNCIEQVEYIEKEITKFDYIENREKQITKLENKYKAYEKLNNKLFFIEKNIEDTKKINEQIKYNEKYISCSHIVIKIQDKIINHIKDKEIYDSLSVLIQEIKKIEKKNKNLSKVIEKKNNLAFLLDTSNKVREYKNKIIVIQNILGIKEELDAKQKEIIKLQKEYSNLMPEICPLCNQEIK